ncbi:VTT domain-containing protein [Xylocopilactobacillus apicola]|uniref:Cytochrome o ubiquinol oxidase n=1 Tax=Xylocopilactobacillus apicola TaxID=2932184 RepID=A0AAU9D0J2_9LACO|nr:VTT domain-containing protein [Xylocopilactobacillus apicola]BDR58206.1 cytochrome o ubiquinol oxidase [Xylocopilactobacillus apicola]
MQFLDYLIHLEKYLPQFIQLYGSWIYVLYFLVLFVETGLVIFPFLPGDSILFLGGSLAALKNGGINLWLLMIISVVAAILGDFVNFEIGKRFGHHIENSPRWQRFIKPEYLKRAQNFFDRYGKISIFLGRFMPIIRTMVPFVAGTAKMTYRHFVAYNLIGGVTWVGFMTLLGYFFGQQPFVQKHFSLILVAIIFISILPAVIVWLKGLLTKKSQNKN